MFDDAQLVVQLAVGLVFLLSAGAKLVNPVVFARGVKEYQILPEALAFGAGLLLIPVEMFLAVSHLTGWLLPFAGPLGLATLASFAAAVAVNLKRGRVLPCYCFGGQSGETISGRTMARLLLLLAGEVVVFAGLDLFGTPQLIYPDRVAAFSELGLLFFWATFLLIAGFWLLNMKDLIALLGRCATCGKRAVGPGPGLTQRPSDSTS